MMDNQNTGVDDNEVNQMIAGLGGAPAAAPVAPPVSAEFQMPTPSDTYVNQVHQIMPPQDVQPTPEPVAETAPTPEQEPAAPTPAETSPENSDFASMKQDALQELRPLVDKLDLPADEKFDTLLLLIRSTDDSSLLPAAHEAARAIADEARRAKALLDVIKEIDYFGQSKVAA